MKKRILLLVFPLFYPAFRTVDAQCISDISYLIESPEPCFFIGSVNSGIVECFEPSTFYQWKYTWSIRGADDGQLIAMYEGMVFQHTFKKFGGYEFCLDIDKDGNDQTPPEVHECITYTTCEACGEAGIEFEYLNCPEGSGCSIQLTASIEAENAIGLKPDAKFIVTYYPTVYELLGGSGAYDIEYPDIDVNYNPQTGLITIAEDITIPYERGCFKPRLQLEMEYGAGAHDLWYGTPCQYVEVLGEETFRCIACTYGDGDCKASILATEQGGCGVFNCTGLRSVPGNDPADTHQEPGAFRIGPNPAKDHIFIELPESQSERQVMLYDAYGRLAQSATCFQHQKLDVAQVANGIYFLVVAEEGRPVFSGNIVISK